MLAAWLGLVGVLRSRDVASSVDAGVLGTSRGLGLWSRSTGSHSKRLTVNLGILERATLAGTRHEPQSRLSPRSSYSAKF